MQAKGLRLITELKTVVLETMQGIPECKPGQSGVPYSEIEDLAALDLNLSKQNGWLTWSVLASLSEEGLVKVEKRGRRLFWMLP